MKYKILFFMLCALFSLLYSCEQERFGETVLVLQTTTNCTEAQMLECTYVREPDMRQDLGIVEIFNVLDEHPRFPGCEHLELTILDKKHCADDKLVAFINEHLVYPTSAVENQIEGTVVVSTVVRKCGCLEDIEIIKSLSENCDREALRIVASMPNNWMPGRMHGRDTSTVFVIPIKFQL